MREALGISMASCFLLFLQKKYEDSFILYLESIDKYIMDSIYKKVKNGTASEFENSSNTLNIFSYTISLFWLDKLSASFIEKCFNKPLYKA